MAQTQIDTVEMDTQYAAYKQLSGAAVATTQALVKIQQMKVDATQCPLAHYHMQTLKELMEVKGVCKGKDIHAYIDTWDPAWGSCTQANTILLLNHINAQNTAWGNGKVTIGVLPEDIPLRITNRLHHLHAFCRYLADHWGDIEIHKPPLDSLLMDCSFADDLSKPSTKILAQDNACWIVKIEYIHK